MPVTARLSRAFYEKLGDEIANELVNWFNAVDLTYRTELKELNDLNFARFDAKVGERLAELRAELRAEFGAELDRRFTELRSELDGRLTQLRSEWDRRFAQSDARFGKVHERLNAIGDQIRDAKVSTIRWMFGFWVGTGVMVLGWFITRWLAG